MKRVPSLLIALAASASARPFVTPIGPFAPFRSAVAPIDKSFHSLATSSSSFATEMARLSLAYQMGNEPDRDRVRELADQMDAAYRQWEALLASLASSSDFQCREYFEMTRGHLRSQGQSFEQMGELVKWQAASMRAFAVGTLPPQPPAGVDLEKLSSQSQSTSPFMASVTIDCTPFDGSQDFIAGNEVISREFQALCKDHASLVAMGERYGEFDPVGKLAFLDAIDAVAERWDVFYARFDLLGALNVNFVEQTESFLSSMGLTAEQFRELVADAHAAMREEAEAARP